MTQKTKQQVRDLLRVVTAARQAVVTALLHSKAVMVLLHRAGTVDHKVAMASNSQVATANSQGDTVHHQAGSPAVMDGLHKVPLRVATHHSKVVTVLLPLQDIRASRNAANQGQCDLNFREAGGMENSNTYGVRDGCFCYLELVSVRESSKTKTSDAQSLVRLLGVIRLAKKPVIQWLYFAALINTPTAEE